MKTKQKKEDAVASLNQTVAFINRYAKDHHGHPFQDITSSNFMTILSGENIWNYMSADKKTIANGILLAAQSKSYDQMLAEAKRLKSKTDVFMHTYLMDDEENIYQELDEYVVTKELRKHFRDFFDNYEKGIDGYTDKMGVWISGFFGSGKSHFLKILSYILKNSKVEGKRAIEYFTDGKKIDDPMLIAKMTKAGTISSDVMLFNIDSKGSAKVGSGKEAIVEVFMKVFNEMQGYCGSIPYLAEFERQLDNEGKFEDFKQRFEEIAGAPWEKKRQAFAVIQDKIVKTIVDMDFMSEEAARNWCKSAKNSYDLSIEKFVSLVQEYCAKKGKNHHVIFLVDEIGQYIADDTQLMLNLQTIVEDLGTACRGKAWVIVTSQEDIDSITKTKGNDFSKIQGRFDTKRFLLPTREF